MKKKNFEVKYELNRKDKKTINVVIDDIKMPLSKAILSVLFSRGPKEANKIVKGHNEFAKNLRKLDSLKIATAEADMTFQKYHYEHDSEYSYFINGEVFAKREESELTIPYVSNSVNNVKFTEEENKKLEEFKKENNINEEIDWEKGYYSINGQKVSKQAISAINGYKYGRTTPVEEGGKTPAELVGEILNKFAPEKTKADAEQSL